MPTTGCAIEWKKVVGVTAVFAAFTILGLLTIDIPLAEFISKNVGMNFLLSQAVANIPDTLLALVCATTLGSWAGRFYLPRKKAAFRTLDFLEFTGCAVPLAFIVKQVLKDIFGRTSTRLWLIQPTDVSFHWFQGGGDFSAFPSGHMAVFTALLLAISRFFPPLRPLCLGALAVLAAALLLTQYHFFSDLAFGVFIGLASNWVAGLGLSAWHNRRDRRTGEPQ